MAKTKKHAQKRAKKDREDVEEVDIGLKVGDLSFKGLFKGIGSLLGLVEKMEKQGKSEYREEQIVKGKTASGKDVRGVYGLRVRTGLGKAVESQRVRFRNIRSVKKGKKK